MAIAVIDSLTCTVAVEVLIASDAGAVEGAGDVGALLQVRARVERRVLRTLVHICGDTSHRVRAVYTYVYANERGCGCECERL